MNERMFTIPIDMVNPDNAAGLGDNDYYLNVPCDVTVVYVSAGANADDPDLTLDINDDASGVITGIDCATKADPGEWISTHFGGTNAPVRIAADSEISFDANDAANATVLHGYMIVLGSDVYG
jgi:hypothetical protein